MVKIMNSAFVEISIFHPFLFFLYFGVLFYVSVFLVEEVFCAKFVMNYDVINGFVFARIVPHLRCGDNKSVNSYSFL